MAPATRVPCPTRSRRWARPSTRASRSSASAWGTSWCRWRKGLGSTRCMSATAGPTIRWRTSTPGRSRWRPRTTASRSIRSRLPRRRPAWRISIWTTIRSRGSSSRPSPACRCSTTRRPPPARTTATITSTASWSWWPRNAMWHCRRPPPSQPSRRRRRPKIDEQRQQGEGRRPRTIDVGEAPTVFIHHAPRTHARPKCPSAPTSRPFSSSGPAPSWSGRPASSTTAEASRPGP